MPFPTYITYSIVNVLIMILRVNPRPRKNPAKRDRCRQKCRDSLSASMFNVIFSKYHNVIQYITYFNTSQLFGSTNKNSLNKSVFRKNKAPPA